MLNPWIGIILVLIALGGLIGGLALLQKTKSPHPELIRKLLHIGMGLVTLSFPWVFTQSWPVILLAILSVTALFAVKFMQSDSLTNVVHGVARESLGEIYFPIAIALLFIVSHQQPILYVIPVLLLTLADAVAALIGVKYGQVTFTTADGVKSTEGSIAFFTVAFLSTLVPLLLFTTIGRAELLLIALIIATLVMYIEALSWKGLDNLFIPLGTFLLLKVYMTMGVTELSIRFVVIVLLFISVVIWRKKTTLNDSAILAVALAGYVIWAAGDWRWLLPAILVFISYHRLSPKTEQNKERIHDARAVLAVATPAMIWLFLAGEQGNEQYYFPFTVSFSAQLGMIALARLRHQYPELGRINLWVRCLAQAGLIIFIPWLLIMGVNFPHLLLAGVGVALTGLAVVGFYYWQPQIEDCPTDNARYWRQSFIGIATSTASITFL